MMHYFRFILAQCELNQKQQSMYNGINHKTLSRSSLIENNTHSTSTCNKVTICRTFLNVNQSTWYLMQIVFFLGEQEKKIVQV